MPVSFGQKYGNTAPVPDNSTTNLPFRQGAYNETIVSEYLPQYAFAALAGQVYSARAALVATTAVGTAMVGLQLHNPSTNYALVVTGLGGDVVATSATQTGVVLASGTGQPSAPTSTTAISVQKNNYLGKALGQGIAYNAGTFVSAPTATRSLLHNTAAIATTGEDIGYYHDPKGSIIVPPQCYICFAAVGATGAAASNNHWIEWIEVQLT